MWIHNAFEWPPSFSFTRGIPPIAFADKPSEVDGLCIDNRQVAIVLHDDRQHTLRYCKRLLREVFGMSETAATVITWVINTEGRAVAWTGGREEAHQLCEKVLEFQRRVDERHDALSQSSLDAGHPPMRTTIEDMVGRGGPNSNGEFKP